MASDSSLEDWYIDWILRNLRWHHSLGVPGHVFYKKKSIHGRHFNAVGFFFSPIEFLFFFLLAISILDPTVRELWNFPQWLILVANWVLQKSVLTSTPHIYSLTFQVLPFSWDEISHIQWIMGRVLGISAGSSWGWNNLVSLCASKCLYSPHWIIGLTYLLFPDVWVRWFKLGPKELPSIVFSLHNLHACMRSSVRMNFRASPIRLA